MNLLIPLVLKSFMLAGAAVLFLRLFRHRSAAARSVVAHLALLALVLVPTASLILPPLQVAVPGPAADGGSSFATWIALYSAAMTVPNAMPAAAAAADTAGNHMDWAMLGYALPAIGLLFIILLALGRLFALRARADVLADPIWLNALAHAQHRMGLRHGTTLLVSDELPSPISWGLVRPVILLNQEALRVPQHAEAIIAHELAHIVRFDWAKLLFARVLTALYWFNPCVWILVREAHQLREETADDAVLAANIAGTDYAELLVGGARRGRKGLLLPAHGVAPSRKSLDRRVRRVLDATLVRGPAARSFAAGVGVIILAAATPLAALTFDAKPAPSPTALSSSSPAAAGGVLRKSLIIASAAQNLAAAPGPSGTPGRDAAQATTVTKPEIVSLAVKVESDGSCGVYWKQSRMTSKNLRDWAVAKLKADTAKAGGIKHVKVEDLPEVHLRGDDTTPWRCVAGTIFTMQRAGYPKIGFISLPTPAHEVKIFLSPPPPFDPVRNKVTVAANGAISWNGGTIDLVRLRQYLDQTVTMVPEPELLFQPDGDARYERVDGVLGVIKRAGVTKLGFVGNEQYYKKF